MSSSDQVVRRNQRALSRASRRSRSPEEITPMPSTSRSTFPPIPQRNPSRPNTPSQSPDLTRTIFPLEPDQFPPPRTPINPTTQLARTMSDTGNHKETSTKLNTKNLEFSGRKADFQAWKDVIELYMIGNPSQFPDDSRKIAFALSWMCRTKDVKIWASNQQRALQCATDWGTWSDFEDILENEFGDPAAETQAKEFLLHYKQGNMKARPYFSTLELWFNLANITTDDEKYAIVKRTMNPTIRSSFLLVGIPKTYDTIKAKMIMLEDEEDKVASFNPRALDSRLGDSSTAAQRNYTPASASYRVQGHTPARPHLQTRLSIKEILAMPKETRPKTPTAYHNRA